MKFKLLTLYSKNNSFERVNFKDGVNLIFGEKAETGETKNGQKKKTNGVGKSMVIECISFCLFKDFQKSRLAKVPQGYLQDDTFFLEVEINGKNLLIERSIMLEKTPSITIDGGEKITFQNIDDASKYMMTLFDISPRLSQISFRELISPLIKDEECGFKELTKYHKDRYGSFESIRPQAFFFGIDILLLNDINKISDEIDKITKYKSKLKKEILSTGIKIADVKKSLNANKAELKTFENKIEELETNIANTSIEKDIGALNVEINKLKAKQQKSIYQLEQISMLPKFEKIDTADIQSVYNSYQEGLGQLIKKSLDEVVGFNNKIEEFNSMIMSERLNVLHKELKDIEGKISKLEHSRKILLENINNQGLLADFKNMFSVLKQKKDHMDNLEFQYNEYEKQPVLKRELETKKTSYITELDKVLEKIQNIEEDFNEILVNYWTKVMSNSGISFEIKASTTKSSILEFILRGDSDGSHSVDRLKVFTYDIALMTGRSIGIHHPEFLIHDNIFDVDQDSLIKSLNLLSTLQETFSFQYILTLGGDKVYVEEGDTQLLLNTSKNTILTLTKEKTFFNFMYQEE